LLRGKGGHRMSLSNTPIRTVVCVVGLGLALVQTALAAETRPIRFNAADQAAAKAVTLKPADLGPGWKGGATKPNLVPKNLCPIKVSDLVLTGAAKSAFETQGAAVTSESNILQSAAMVAAEWKRSVGNTAFMVACTRKEVTGENVKLVSFKKMAFPKLTQYSARYRVVADFGKPGGRVHALVDMIVLGQGRTEISIILTARYEDRAIADIAEGKMASILVSRITR
jgi:hypothetical protein